MSSSKRVLRLVSYNCRGWNSGVRFIRDIAPTVDVCLIQEHWLFSHQLALLNFDSDFVSCGVSGMENDHVLRGRPFGGCGIIFRKNLMSIRVIKTQSKCFCAVYINNNCESILLINVYLPTDYHTDTSDADFNICLGELSGFIDSQAFDYLLIGGDFNTNLHFNTSRYNILKDFMLEYDLVCVDLSTSITHTYERDGGLVTSWPDHFLVNSSLAGYVSSVRTLQTGSNLSDHLPLYADLKYQLPLLSIPKTDHDNAANKVHWEYISNSEVECFRNC